MCLWVLTVKSSQFKSSKLHYNKSGLGESHHLGCVVSSLSVDVLVDFTAGFPWGFREVKIFDLSHRGLSVRGDF